MLTEHLNKIAGLEEISVDDEAVAMIARAAEGSVRDALSIFDQAIAHGAGTVDAPKQVRSMLGLADRARIVDLFEHLMKGDAAAALTEFRAQYDVGADPAAVLTDLAEFNHLVTRLRFVPSAANDVSLSEDERRRGGEFAKQLSVRVLSRTWQMLIKGIPEVQSSNRPASAAEMVLIRIAHAADLPTLDEALKSLGDAPQAPSGPAPRRVRIVACPSGHGGASAVATSRMPVTSGGGQTMRLVEAAPTPAEVPAPMLVPPQPVAEAPPAVPVKSLEDIAALADANRDMLFKTQFKSCIRLVRIEPGPSGYQPYCQRAQKPGRPILARGSKNGPAGAGWCRFRATRAGRRSPKRKPPRRATPSSMRRTIRPWRRSLRAFPARRSSTCAYPTRRRLNAGDADLPPEPAADDDETDF